MKLLIAEWSEMLGFATFVHLVVSSCLRAIILLVIEIVQVNWYTLIVSRSFLSSHWQIDYQHHIILTEPKQASELAILLCSLVATIWLKLEAMTQEQRELLSSHDAYPALLRFRYQSYWAISWAARSKLAIADLLVWLVSEDHLSQSLIKVESHSACKVYYHASRLQLWL